MSSPKPHPSWRFAKWALAAVPVLIALDACAAPPHRTHHAGSAPVTDSVASPAWVVDQFFGWTTFPSERGHVTEGFHAENDIGVTAGGQIAASSRVSSRQISRSDTGAVFETTIRGGPGEVQEAYTYLAVEQKVWKLAAVRSLGFTGNLRIMLDSIRKGKKIRNAPPRIQSILELAVSGDSEVMRYFTDHAQPINALTQAFRAQTTLGIVDVADPLTAAERTGKITNPVHAQLRAQLDNVDASTIFKSPKYPGCTFIRIGGANTQQVGFLYAPKGSTPPVMSPAQFILIERMTGDWFLYRSL